MPLMLRKARLAEHRHTAKLLPHHHTHYQGLLVVVAIGMVCAVLISRSAQAFELQVSASIPATMPATAPTLDSPADGYVSEQPTVTLSGSCPVVAPAVVVAAYEGTNFLGSGLCNSQGGYTIPVYLTPGQHLLQTRIVTVTGDFGQSSQLISVTYQPLVGNSANGLPTPVGPTTVGNSGGAVQQTNVAALHIQPLQLFIRYSLVRDAIWDGIFSGGTAPYTTRIYWGDGTVQRLPKLLAGQHSFRHQYDKFGNYTMRLELTDVSGRTAAVQVAAIGPDNGLIRPNIAGMTLGGITYETVAIRLYMTMVAMIIILAAYEHYVRTPKISHGRTMRGQ